MHFKIHLMHKSLTPDKVLYKVKAALIKPQVFVKNNMLASMQKSSR